MVGRIIAGLTAGADLTIAGGLREGGWSARDPVEESVE